MLAACFVALPEPAALRAGAALGRAGAALFRRRTREARANLRRALPDLGEAERAALWRRSAEELGRAAAEWARLPRLSEQELLARVDVTGLEHLTRAVARGRGVLGITAHYGNWEYIPAVIRARLPSLTVSVVGRTMPSPQLQAWIETRRTRGGGEVLPQDARAILRALRSGAMLGVLADHYTRERRGGVLAPFLGLRAWTTPGPALLALRSGAAIVPVHIRRIGGSAHRIEIEPELELPQTGDRKRDVAMATALMNQAIERWIREDPAPWTWSHRRFRRSPDLPEESA